MFFPTLMCASRNIVNTISCRVFDTFHQTLANDALWDRDVCFTVCHSGMKYAGQNFLGLLTQCLEKY